MNLLFNYKSILLKVGIVLSMTVPVYWCTSNLKSTIRKQASIIQANQLTISNLKAELQLSKSNCRVDIGSIEAQIIADKAKDDILSLKELEHEIQENNTTKPFNNILNGVFFKSPY